MPNNPWGVLPAFLSPNVSVPEVFPQEDDVETWKPPLTDDQDAHRGHLADASLKIVQSFMAVIVLVSFGCVASGRGGLTAFWKPSSKVVSQANRARVEWQTYPSTFAAPKPSLHASGPPLVTHSAVGSPEQGAVAAAGSPSGTGSQSYGPDLQRCWFVFGSLGFAFLMGGACSRLRVKTWVMAGVGGERNVPDSPETQENIEQGKSRNWKNVLSEWVQSRGQSPAEVLKYETLSVSSGLGWAWSTLHFEGTEYRTGFIKGKKVHAEQIAAMKACLDKGLTAPTSVEREGGMP